MACKRSTPEDRAKLIKETREYISVSGKFRELLLEYDNAFCDAPNSEIYDLQDRIFTLDYPADEICEYLGKQSD